MLPWLPYGGFSQASAYPGPVERDLEDRPAAVFTVALKRSGVGGDFTVTATLEGSNERETWREVGQVIVADEAPANSATLDSGDRWRYLRVSVTGLDTDGGLALSVLPWEG